jgi:peptidoglycan/LPS O-acetylase OafA/YrhL
MNGGGTIVKVEVTLERNNLDCLRLILAGVVVLTHVHRLTQLAVFDTNETYFSADGAVKSFYVISGLLVYRSYMRSSSLKSYLEKRFRRIYPAYFVVIVLAAVALWLLSGLHATQYFGTGFWKYLGANLLFLNFLAPSLPGVFETNSISAVNGALWTLKIEVVFYFLVPIIYYLCRQFGTKRVISIICILSCLWKYGFTFLASMDLSRGPARLAAEQHLFRKLEFQFPSQLVYFSAGILLLLFFDKLKQYFAFILFLTVCVFVLDHWLANGALDAIWIAGGVFIIGFWRYFGNFAKYGDISYGVYIVHWPILQTLIFLGFARLHPAVFLALSLSVIFLTSVLLWYLVEKRFLARGSHYRHGAATKAIVHGPVKTLQ